MYHHVVKYPTFPPLSKFLPGLCLLAAMACGCSETRHQIRKDDPLALSKYLADNPDAPDAYEVKKLLARLEFDKAAAANSVYAWRLFLERFGDTPLAVDARSELEKLLFEQAVRRNSVEALEAFLRSNPRSSLAGEAKKVLEQLECSRLESVYDIDVLQRQARRQLPCKDELKKRLVKLRFRKAIEEGSPKALFEFVELHGDTVEGNEARKRLAAMRCRALVHAAHFSEALSLSKLHPDACPAEMVGKAKLTWRMLEFELQVAPPSMLKKEHETLSEKWKKLLRRNPGWFAILARASQDVRRAAEDIERLYAGQLPGTVSERLTLVRQLEGACDTNAAELLLELSTDAYFEIRRRAIAALEKVVRCVEPVLAASWLQRRYDSLRKKAGNGPLLFPLALAQWLMDRREAALQSLLAYYADAERPDPVALAMGTRLALLLGLERQALLLLRDFTSAAENSFTERRKAWSDGSIDKSSNGVLTLMQVCGLVRVWREVLELFDGIHVADGELGGGSWLADSRMKYENARRWHEANSKAWQPAEAGWSRCNEDKPDTRLEREITEAVRRIVWFPRAWTGPLAKWLDCCHPAERVRDLARVLAGQREVAEQAGLVLPVWNLTSPAALHNSSIAAGTSSGR